jgi:hypothetical protein
MTDTTPATPEWLKFINFEGRITGPTAQVIKDVAESRGVTPEQVLTEALCAGLNVIGWGNPGRSEVDAQITPWTPNEGCGGFHVVTVVADGYGFIVAEDQNGKERARVACQDPDEADANPGKDLADLMAKFTEVVEAERNG